jgi:two-component system cell cycle response regulator DivK
VAKKILIIEDNENNLKLFSTILKVNGYETIEAKNGSDGIRLAKSEKPHLILTDIQMPYMNGFEVFKILKSDPSTKDIPSIALTAMKEKREKFINIGFVDHIAKPIRLNDFLKTIEKHLNRGLEHKE